MSKPDVDVRPRLLRTAQAARYLNLSPWKLRKLVADGRLPVVQDVEGAPFLLDIQDLDAYIAANKHSVIVPM